MFKLIIKNLKLPLQTFCVIVVSFGIVYECLYGASLGLILITVGSLAFAISTKIDNAKNHNNESN